MQETFRHMLGMCSMEKIFREDRSDFATIAFTLTLDLFIPLETHNANYWKAYSSINFFFIFSFNIFLTLWAEVEIGSSVFGLWDENARYKENTQKCKHFLLCARASMLHGNPPCRHNKNSKEPTNWKQIWDGNHRGKMIFVVNKKKTFIRVILRNRGIPPVVSYRGGLICISAL